MNRNAPVNEKALRWVICGPGRGVGKTHLAHALCQALPRAVYAKLGQSARKPGKPANYFRTVADLEAFVAAQCGQHFVLEANQLAHTDSEAIVILLDAPVARVRSDMATLRRRADLVVGPTQTRSGWLPVLASRGIDPELADRICACLVAQRDYLFPAASADPEVDPSHSHHSPA